MLRRIASCLLVAAALGCGSSDSAGPAGTNIGSAGGTVTSRDGRASLVVPPGALASTVRITLDADGSTPADSSLEAGTAYRVGPAGVSFAVPALLSLPYGVLGGVPDEDLRVRFVSSPTSTDVPSAVVRDSAAHRISVPIVRTGTFAVGAAQVHALVIGGDSALYVGVTRRLTVSALDVTGRLISAHGPVRWSTSDPRAATVDSLGSLTIHGLGTIQLSATMLGHSVTRDVAIPFGWKSISTTATYSGGFSVHTCGIGLDDRAYCWGYGVYGRVNGGAGFSTTPLVMENIDASASLLESGGGYSCGVWSSGVLCAGYNGGRFGNGSTLGSRELVAGPSLSVKALALGDFETCAIDAADVGYCWGDTVVVPRAIAGGYHWRRLSVSESNTCGVTTGGALYCWGSGFWGANGTGPGDTSSTAQPTQPVPGGPWIDVAVASNAVCGLQADGAAWCWGSNGNYQLGQVSGPDRSAVPLQVAGGHHFVRLDAGTGALCGLTADGEVWCWGATSAFDPSGSGSSIPELVSGALHFQSISVGSGYLCGVALDTSAWCWGYNGAGTLGNGSLEPSNTPVRVHDPI